MSEFFQVISKSLLFVIVLSYKLLFKFVYYQWLKTGTVKKVKHNVDIDQSPRISQDTSNTLVQYGEKAHGLLFFEQVKRENTVMNT